ncbi:hypothetical protein [Streptomyces sp. NPDC048411]|uniref:hypothetical protein n=1 Tax=unclassified Streptomyces TaxID=2593676 RepID=UPI0034526C65
MSRIAGTLHLVALTAAARRDTAGMLDALDQEALPALPDGDVAELGDFGEQGR